MTSRKRVVVTGMGVFSPIGNTPDAVWHSAQYGISGIDFIRTIDTSELANHIGGEVKDFYPERYLEPRDARRTERYAQFVLAAAHCALEDSGLTITEENAWDIGVIVGTGIGPVSAIRDVLDAYREGGHRSVKPLTVLQTLSDSGAAKVCIRYGLLGRSQAVISACAAGNNAIGDAAELIRAGRAKAMIAGGAEAALIHMVIAGFNNMKTLSHNEADPTKASRPFSASRDGFVPAEGAGLLVLEELEHALARGARIYAEVSGYGNTSDAFHVTAPKEDGLAAARAMTNALHDANLQPEDIGYINAHGTSTPLNDRAETIAIKRAFGDVAYRVPISSTKSITGHALGATPAIEAVISIMALQNQFVPPTINLDDPDPECDLDYVPNEGRPAELRYVMSNAFGFGGHNAVIIFSRYEG